MDNVFNFTIFKPTGHLSAYIQAVWSASVPTDCSSDINRWLHGDGGSGILFNLSSDIFLNDEPLSSGVVFTPVSKQDESVTLPGGSQLVGFRFHPAIGFALFGKHYTSPTTLTDKTDLSKALYRLYEELKSTPSHYAHITMLYRWLTTSIDFTDKIPEPLLLTLNLARKRKASKRLYENSTLSQRQLERQFQKWVDMTPKQYQRILRVRQSLDVLKQNPDTGLVALALSHGFSDQAHMTREFNQIAKITPRQYSKRVACRQKKEMGSGLAFHIERDGVRSEEMGSEHSFL